MGSRFLVAAMTRQVHLWFHFVQFMQTKILSNAIRLSLRNEGDGFNLEQRATTQAGLHQRGGWRGLHVKVVRPNPPQLGGVSHVGHVVVNLDDILEPATRQGQTASEVFERVVCL